jgi:hypothetical protein
MMYCVTIQKDAESMTSISSCVPQIEDYTYMWWADGFRGRSSDGRWLRCIQTGRYGMVMDVETMDILHLGMIDDPLPYPQAGTQDNSVLANLPSANLSLKIIVDGIEYSCIQGGKHTPLDGPRLVESGRFSQRADITKLIFSDKNGNNLDVDARFEVSAWSDRLTLLFFAKPICEKPDDGWKNAFMEIRLSNKNYDISDHIELNSDEFWSCKETKSVAISLLAEGKQMQVVSKTSKVEVSAFAMPDNGKLPVEYDSTYGWWRIGINDIEPQGQGNDVIERARIHIINHESQEATVRLLLDKNGSGFKVRDMSPITGMSAMIRDKDGYPSGIPVQLSKNWHSRSDMDLVYQGLWFHGFTMLRMPAHSEIELELTIVYAHWGGVASASHAQLCLIGWGSNQLWDESAIGAWGESICYEPDQAQAQAAVLDVRPVMVYQMNQDVPLKWNWTNNVGGADFFRYFDSEGKRQFPSRMKTAYHRYGPNLTQVTYAGCSQDGKIEHQATVSIYRTDDMVRGLYSLRMYVKKQVDFSRFVIFQVGADTYGATAERKMAIGNENGLTQEWEAQWGGEKYKTPRIPCTGLVPWISMHEALSQDKSTWGAWANRGIVIRHWEAQLGGKKAIPWIAEYGVNACSLVDIVPPSDVVSLMPGDYVEATFEHIVVPQYAKDYYGPNDNLRNALEKYENTWRMIYREAVGNDLSIQIFHGELVCNRPTQIRAKDNRVHFSITGGIGYVPIIITGLSGYRSPKLEIKKNGTWQKVDQSVYKNDFWQANYVESTGTWDIIYNILLDTPDDERQTQEIRFMLE